jgi:hypothetical protein
MGRACPLIALVATQSDVRLVRLAAVTANDLTILLTEGWRTQAPADLANVPTMPARHGKARSASASSMNSNQRTRTMMRGFRIRFTVAVAMLSTIAPPSITSV